MPGVLHQSKSLRTGRMYLGCLFFVLACSLQAVLALPNHTGNNNLKPLNLPLGPGVIEATQTICSGATPAAFTSTDPATGGTAAYQYQWQISTTGFFSGFSNIPGATGLTYSSPALTQTSYFRRAVSTINEAAVFSDAVRVTVNPISVGGTLTGGGVFCPSPALATFVLSGHTGSIVRWERSTVGDFSSNVTNIANTTTSQQSPIFSTITAPIYYRALVQSGSCASVYSDVDTVSVFAASVGGTISDSDTVCTGTNSTLLTLSGHTGSIVRWQSATNSGFTGTITNISNTTTTHTALNLTVNTWFRAVIKNGTCDSAFSNIGFVKVDSASAGGAVNQNAFGCTGSNTTTLRLTGHRGSIIRWESASNAGFTTALTTINNTLDSLVATNLSTTTFYRAIVKNGECAAAASTHSSITIFALPNGGTLSKDTTVCHGAHAFNLSLSGNGGSIVRWESSTLADFSSNVTTIANTTATQSVTNLTAATYYRVLVRESGPVVTCDNYSNIIKVTIAPLPNGGTVSGSDTVCAGTNSTVLTLSGFSGTISRWQSATTSDFSGTITPIAQTGTQLTATNLSTTTYYRAELVLGNCTSYSAVATVSILAAPVGGTVTGNNPFSNTLIVCSGTNSTVLVLSGQSGTIIRWESALTADFSGSITNIAHTGSQYTAVNLTQTTYFRAIVQRGDCDTARSAPKVITVVQPSVGGTLSGGGSVCSGTNSRPLTLSGHTGTILRWESATTPNFSGTLTSYSNTTTTLTATNLSVKTYYRVWVRNSPCDSTSSAIDSILIDNLSVGGSITGPDTVCHGTNSSVLQLINQVGAIVRWESATTSNFTGTLTTINNTTATHTATNLTTTTYFRAVIKNGSCPEVFSASKAIIVRSAGFGGILTGGSVTVCINSNSTLLTLTNAVGTVVRWESSPVANFSSNVTSIAHTGSTYLASNLSELTYFRVIVQVATCPTTTSSSAFINVQPQPNGGTVVGGGDLCTGNNSIQLTLVGHQGNIVRWESSPFADFSQQITAITNTSTSLNLSNLTTTAYYRAVVQYLNCATVGSAASQVVIIPASVAGELRADTLNRCAGDNQLILRLTNKVGSIVKWQSALNPTFSGTVTDIAVTTDTLLRNNLTQTTYFRAIVKNGVCPADTTDVLGIIIQAASAGGTLTGGNTICTGSNSSLLILSGRLGQILKWQASTSANFSTGVNDIAHTSDSLTVNNLTTTTFYRVIVQNGVCAADTSTSATITVQALSAGGTLNGGSTVCTGSNSSLLILTGRLGQILKWQSSSSANFSTGVNDIAHTSDSLPVNNLSTTTFYRVIVRNGVCAADTSTSATITVQALSAGGTLTGGNTVCSGSNSSLLILTGRLGQILKWQASTSANFSTGVNDIAHTSDSLTVINLSTTTFYRVIVQNGVCAADTSTSATITVQALSAGGTLTGGNTICSGSNSSLLILTGRLGQILKWQSATSANFSTGVNDIAHTSDSLTVNNLSTTTFYRVIVRNGVCAADTSTSATITVQPQSAGGTLTGGNTICSGSNSSLLILTGRLGQILKWQSSSSANFSTGVNDIAHTSDSLAVNNLSTTTFYRVIVQNGVCAADTSTSATIIVQPLSAGGTLTGGNTICSGSNSSLLILTGRLGQILKWQSSSSANFSTGVNDIAHTSDSLTVNNLSTTTFYRVIVQNGVCAADTSTSATITVQPLSVGGTLTGGNTVCSGSNSSLLILTGRLGQILKWQASTSANFSTGVNDIAHTSDSLTVNNLSTTTFYRVIVRNGVCAADTSTAAGILVLVPISLNTINPPNPDSFFVSANPGLITGNNPSGGTGIYVYQWLQSTTGPNAGFTPIVGANVINFDPPLLTQTHWFRRIVSSGSCPADTSQVVQITILPQTPSMAPVLGIALAVDEPTAVNDETFRIIYRYNLQNYGDGGLNRIRVSQNLLTLFPPPATFSIVQLVATGSLQSQPGFDGQLQTELLDSNSSTLSVGQSGSLILELDVNPNLPLATYTNQVVARATAAGSGIIVSDLSTLGTNPDPNADGNPAEAEPTPVSLKLFVPNGFSPDGDGNNDAFVINGIEKYPNNRIEIFNRWGNKIYEAAPYDNSWTGTALSPGAIVIGDGLLPNGTYFYVLDFGIAGVATLNGFVVIKK